MTLLKGVNPGKRTEIQYRKEPSQRVKMGGAFILELFAFGLTRYKVYKESCPILSMDREGSNKWLEKEVTSWRDKGIITDYQAQVILSQYGLAELPEKREERSKLISMVSLLGSVLIGAGAILFIASNWQRIPDSVKLTLSFITTFAVYYTGWRFKFETQSHPRLGHALLFLASILVGVTLFLTAQIFNINANAHVIVFLWFIVILPLGYAFNSSPILGLDIFTFTLWMILYVSATKGFFLGTLETFMLYLLFGISLYGIGQLHSAGKYSHFRSVYQGIGLFFILASYFYFSLRTPYERIFAEASVPRAVQVLFILFGATAVISVIFSNPRFEKFKTVSHEFYILVLAFSGWVTMWLLTLFRDSLTITITQYGYTYTAVDPKIATVLFVVFNVLFFILSVGSILIGYSKGVTSFVNFGMIFFSLGVLHLYFTTVYRLLPRSLAFMIGGLILLGLAWYLEKKRRSLIKEMEGLHE